MRFIPVRFKDGYGPVGAWFLLFKSVATNAFGGNYMAAYPEELEKRAPYGTVKPIPACLRNHLGMLDLFSGKGPIYMQTADAIQRIAETAPDEKAAKRKLKELKQKPTRWLKIPLHSPRRVPIPTLQPSRKESTPDA